MEPKIGSTLSELDELVHGRNVNEKLAEELSEEESIQEDTTTDEPTQGESTHMHFVPGSSVVVREPTELENGRRYSTYRRDVSLFRTDTVCQTIPNHNGLLIL